MPTQWAQDFIKSVQAKYNPTSLSQRQVATPIFGETPALARLAESLPGSGVGTRFTGRGPDNILQTSEPVGMGRAGTMVLSANDVTGAGGPQKIQSAMKQLESQGVSGFRRGGVMPGPGIFHEGEVTIDPKTVKRLGGPDKIMGSIEAMKNMQRAGVKGYTTGTPPIGGEVDPLTGLPKTGASTSSGITPSNQEAVNAIRTMTANREIVRQDMNLPEYKPATSAVKLDINPAYTAAVDKGLAAKQQTMQTGGPAVQAQAAIGRQNLGGVQGAEKQKMANTLAQTNTTGGEALAAIARTNREQAIARSGFEGDVVKAASDAAQAAATDLINAGFQGQQLDINKANFGLQQEQFNEMSRQFAAEHNLNLEKILTDAAEFGMNYAMTKATNDATYWTQALATAREAGDFNGMAKLLESKGLPVPDFSAARTEQNVEILSGMTTFLTTELANRPGASFEEMRPTIEKIFAAQEKPLDENAMRTYFNDTKTGIQRGSDPIYIDICTMQPSELTNYAASALGITAEELNGTGATKANPLIYRGLTGTAAIKAMLTDASSPQNGAITLDKDLNWVINNGSRFWRDISQVDLIGKMRPTGYVTPSTSTPAAITTASTSRPRIESGLSSATTKTSALESPPTVDRVSSPSSSSSSPSSPPTAVGRMGKKKKDSNEVESVIEGGKAIGKKIASWFD